MADIRALERSDLPAVIELLTAHLPNWAPTPEMLEATALDHPWSDPELPSLVATDESGAVIGFIAVQVRRMRFDGEPIRGVCCSHLTVAPGNRRGAPGALLMGQVLKGPQDLTWSDSATDTVVRMWRTFGGNIDVARAADYMLVLNPGRYVAGLARARLGGEAMSRKRIPVAAIPLGRGGRGPAPDLEGIDGEPATPAQIAEHNPAIMARTRAYVDWDAAELEVCIGQLEEALGGVELRLVRRRGRPIGWYAWLRRPGGTSRLLHVAAAERDVPFVMQEAVEHATGQGVGAIAGRAEPHLEPYLRSVLAPLGFAWQPVIRARDPELAATMSSGSSLLSRLDGELSPARAVKVPPTR